ncbi:MAG TPA: ATP-binding protein, partial [Candidatus Kapabacteria bacterium]|nr:ATP-binding protein [Candidatus Kapabacteria bacterium]
EKSVIASKEMYKLMTTQAVGKPLKISIGERERRLFRYLEKHERITVKEFASIVNISRRRAERILIDLVRAKVILIHNDTNNDYFSLAPNINLD